MKLYKSKKLLNIDNNAKTIKGQKYKYMTAILYLSPARTSGFNVCALASAGCMASCLNTAGRGQMGSVQLGRINKTNKNILHSIIKYESPLVLTREVA